MSEKTYEDGSSVMEIGEVVGDTYILGADGTQVEAGTEGAYLRSSFEANLVDNKYEADFNGHKIYLNSPLLKGDKLISKQDGIYHYHTRQYRDYVDGDLTNIDVITDGTTRTLELLATPYEERVANNFLLDNLADGTITTNSNVPVEITKKAYTETLDMLKANTLYRVQFESDADGFVTLGLGGAIITSLEVYAGLNACTITTPTTLVNNDLTISGDGMRISNKMITEGSVAYPYFEGMRSIADEPNEDGKYVIDIKGYNALTDDAYVEQFKQFLLNEPLRGLPSGVKDRPVKINGKWFIERNCGERDYIDGDITNINVKTDGIKTIYQLTTPIYEPMEINPEFNCYDGITYIESNTFLPMNKVIKNTGLSCKALSTPNTVVHNGDSSIVSKVDLTDNMVRLSGKGKKVSNIMVLDGEVKETNGYFDGMMSSFENELITDESDPNHGKYKVRIITTNMPLVFLEESNK